MTPMSKDKNLIRDNARRKKESDLNKKKKVFAYEWDK